MAGSTAGIKKSEHALRVVVVGNGMVGHHFVEQALELAGTNVSLTVIGGEPQSAYDRVHLSSVFDGTAPGELALASPTYYADNGVKALFGQPVTQVDRTSRTVTTADGTRVEYDRLVLATGSYPFVPPIRGGDSDGCLTYRTLDDLDAIRSAAAGARIGTVVGGGLLGLECANALRNLGLETHVVEFAPGLMGVQLDSGGSNTLRRKIEALGVVVHTDTATELIRPGSKRALCMEFAAGDQLETDVIVFSAGIRPYDTLARDCGLTVGERGGISVDEHCRTSDPDVFAIGECAVFDGRIYGLVAPGYRMAEVAASQLTETPRLFAGADMSTKLKLLGVDVGAIGDAKGNTPGARAFTWSDEHNDVYKRLVVNADGSRVLGAVLVGDADAYDSLLQYHLNDIALPAAPEALILPATDGGVAPLGASALPATATICSCHNVSKGAVIEAIDAGAAELADVKTSTRASTGCGGCAALLKHVVDDELSARGIEVSRAICEHFDHSRQELFDIVRSRGLRTFAELISQHGTGLGCDICKPAVASMLASHWNDYILDEKHRGLQDTNDLHLGNMQKNGTYSVVPRVPGGEITPDKLIVLGEVAQEFDLYTKITGGQRIDLFGAHVHELPAIWRRLVDAGFETGHAYGKAMRTVKSCVGSTWCRFGVQDSVGMAVFIENRYKGLRAPHKIKLAVSGCTRECAEAQSKDVGIIATEGGWNLYVCGNGGMRPRHADLFATDLSDAQLIQYIDRFLMFYVRTADRLQRTSVWLENLDGGLGYLREVVIDDRLGIGADLEAQMQSLIDTYQCEWKTTIDDPERLKRFRHFVNSDAPDAGVQFVRERGQKRPSTHQPLADNNRIPAEDIA